MADNKKYYYLRLKEDFFESEEMVILESMPNGYIYSNILLKLYLRSLKNEGKLMFKNRIPYNSMLLSQLTRHNTDIVEKALKVFQELGLVEILDNGAIYMSDIQAFIGKTTTEADRIRSYRNRIEKEKVECSNKSVQMYGKCTPEIEIEKEIEKDIKLLLLEEEKQENSIFEKFETEFCRPLSPIELQFLQEWKTEFSDDIIMVALKQAVKNNARSFRYIEVILNSWKKAGVRNVEEANMQISKKSNINHKQSKISEMPEWYDNQDLAQPQGIEVDDDELKKLQEKLGS